MTNNITIADLIKKLEETRALQRDEYKTLLACSDDMLRERASKVRQKVYGNRIFIRGLVEFTNYCKNDCYYCGLRRGNTKAERYRLTLPQILGCCDNGYKLGFRTFVLQGGEDPYYSDENLCEIVSRIRTTYPDCAITLSIGERERDSYKRLFDAGADRYLLRQETSDPQHYSMLHPSELTLESRKRCLWDLKEIGYQVGCGFMVGSPGQTLDHIVDDLQFIQELKPAMVGIGPFIPHCDTPFGGKKAGDLSLTLNTLAILRLMRPDLLLPSTTALGTLDPNGRELGVMAGANVVMPNLSPPDVRKKYLLYDGKICTNEEAAECISCLRWRMAKIGCELHVGRGDPIVI